MRDFGPSALAYVAGVLWLAVTTTLLPAEQGERALPAGTTVGIGDRCSTATMIARLPQVHEASGLAVSRRRSDILWTHSDSGDPILYAVGTDGTTRGRVRVTGATLEDWEDVASGSCPEGSCLYIADVGDNKQARPHVTIYRVAEPDPDARATSPASAAHVAYPDGPKDAESLFVGPDDRLYLVTKGEGAPISIYRVPAASATGVGRLEHVATLAGDATRERRITGADSSPDRRWVALRTLESVEFHAAGPLLAGNGAGGIEVKLTKIGEPQGEGVAMLQDGTVYLTGEGADGVQGGTLARLSCKLPG